ncbi:hypothetical protein [Methylobacterium sp. PvR107]|nr:hypothetical protein [Methylobacterium sp. PvR107]MBP1182571.1 hypothetical protein [Methylobacterium sp. PvR107]
MPITPRPRHAARRSLFQNGIGLRLTLAGALSAFVWLAIAWALTA